MNTIAQRIEKVADMIVEEHDLNHGNYEFFIQGGNAYITIEAPNNSTVTAYVILDDELSELEDGDLQNKILWELADTAHTFDDGDYFNEIYSPEFGEHNGFEPAEFAEMLKEDKQFFEDFYDEVMVERK